MAKTGKKTRKKRAPFMERFSGRLVKLKEWISKTQPRFASAPNSDVSDSLGALDDTLDAIVEATKALKSWSPPAARAGSFSVGDVVAFKRERLDELVKAGFFDKNDLTGAHKIEAINGRKVKLGGLGVFQSLYVTKSA